MINKSKKFKDNFKFHNYFNKYKIGEGSDRIVYEYDTNKVIKYAKNKRGIIQNINEYKMSIKQKGKNRKIIPLIYYIDKNNKYLIMEKVNCFDKINIDKNECKEFKFFYEKILEIKHLTYIKPLNYKEAFLFLKKYNIEYILTDDLMWGDFLKLQNWGINSKNEFVHLDGGTFSKPSLVKYK